MSAQLDSLLDKSRLADIASHKTPSIDVSHEGIAARTARIEAAARAARLRQADMAAARDIRRKHGLNDLAELFQELNGVMSAYINDDGWKQRLRDLCSDMEDEMTPAEPEVLGWDKRGEFDSATAGVRGRSA